MYIERLHPRWVKFLLSGGAAEDVPLPARISALNYPLMVALASISMWLIAGVFFSSYGGRVSQFRNFIGIFVVGGVLTCALIFFAFEILWRPVVLLFFPEWTFAEYPCGSVNGVWQVVDRILSCNALSCGVGFRHRD